MRIAFNHVKNLIILAVVKLVIKQKTTIKLILEFSTN